MTTPETRKAPLGTPYRLVSKIMMLIGSACPLEDSNLRTRLRRPLLYPLS